MTWATATPQTITPPPLRAGQGVVRRDSTTLDICILQMAPDQKLCLGLYLHPTEILLNDYLIETTKGRTSYVLPIQVERWRGILEQMLVGHNLTSVQLQWDTLRNSPEMMYAYLFGTEHYRRVGQMLMPDFPPPYWDVMNKPRTTK